jgi:hypothetical protein
MSLSSHIATLTEGIAALKVDRVSIKSIGEIPASGRMICPVFYPDPEHFISGYSFDFEALRTNTAALVRQSYDLNYIYLHCEVGSGISPFLAHVGMVENFSKFLIALFSNDELMGLMDISLGNMSDFGVVSDPSDIEYWGFQFSLRVAGYNQ